jgi:inorganic triphosphatase YgiF
MGTDVAAEVEVKLDAGAAEVLREIGALGNIAGYELRAHRVERLRTLYLDTRTLALMRAGVAVRLRHGPDGWQATIKWSGRVVGGVHERPELNVALPGRPPLPFRLPSGPLHTHLAATVLERPLAPILVSEVQRRVLHVHAARRGASPLAELALDTVRLRAPDGRALGPRYWEVEIERRDGTRADLLAISRTLRERFALIPSPMSKFARGLEALYGARARFAPPAAVSGGTPLSIAARAIFATHLARLRGSDAATRAGDDAGALHDMRVTVRRLRAAIRMLAPVIPARSCELLRRDLPWLGRELGAVRDLDVQLANLDWHRGRLAANLHGPLDGPRRAMRRERRSRRAHLLVVLDSARYLRLLATLERLALSRPRRYRKDDPDEPLAAVGRRAVRKTIRRLLARGDAIGDLPAAADLHALRIRAKRLRYLLEALGSITGKPGRKLERHLARLQDVLGRFTDAMVAAGWLRGYTGRPGAALDAPTRALLEQLADTELQRAGVAQADFRRAWRGFRGRRVERVIKDVLRRLERAAESGEAGAPPAAV